nr:acid trehalase-like protein 1 isoform X3 [Microcebus murinus]
MLWTPVPPALTLAEGQEDGTWDFLTVVGSSQAEAQACLAEAMQLQAGGALYSTHTRAWAQLWAGRGLDVAGPLPLRQALRGSLYYLLSALPPPGATEYICHGLSPGGLSNGSREECYWGHVFWDQELWMFPLVLMLHPEAARAILEYRVRTLGGALQNAHNLGYQGAKFAWESAGSGLEVCPEDIYGTQEIHINGAVVLAFELYYHATQDLQLFREAGGWDVVSAVAEFWCSRVEWSPREEQYHLRGVMPPDEYHAGVDNSVYTNVVAQNSLRFAAALAWDLGLPVPKRWLEVADKIKVPFDQERNFHPEFDGYEPGEWTLGSHRPPSVHPEAPPPPSAAPPFRRAGEAGGRGAPGVPGPLLPESRCAQEKPGGLRGRDVPPGPRHDLGEQLRGGGSLPTGFRLPSPHCGPHPSLSSDLCPQSMFAVGWMELKDPEQARNFLDRSFANAAEPFKVWTENADGSGAVNFLTGMGGFLQAVLFGCTGFRVTRAGVTFDPVCPAGVPRVCVSGIFYRGNKLNFSFSEDSVTVEVTAQPGPGAAPLEAELWPSGAQLPLRPGEKISFPRSAGRIQKSAP